MFYTIEGLHFLHFDVAVLIAEWKIQLEGLRVFLWVPEGEYHLFWHILRSHDPNVWRWKLGSTTCLILWCRNSCNVETADMESNRPGGFAIIIDMDRYWWWTEK